MSSLFSKPDTSAQEKQLKIQQEQIEAQEKRQEAEKAELGASLQAKARARQRGGRRMLLADREDAELGLPSQLGIGVNRNV